MKKTIFILSLATFTGLQAQNTPIQIEVVDRTEITMLAAQYDVMMREKREAQAQENYNGAYLHYQNFSKYLNEWYAMTNDKDLIKRINKAIKQNERLLSLYNSRRYQTEFFRLETQCNQIGADLKKLKPSR